MSCFVHSVYINELARAQEQSSASGLTLLDSEITCLLCADDLVLLSPTKEGLQQHLDLLHRFCQTNLSKTKIMVFQKRSSGQDHKYKLYWDTTGNFHTAVNALRDKARRAFFYATTRNIKIDIPIGNGQKMTSISYRTHCPLWLWGLGYAHQPIIHKIGKTPNWDSTGRIYTNILCVQN
jgi:hypothetical protein